MKIPSSKTLHDMEIAAELRAAGATWENIAEKLKRHPTLLIRWTTYYREDWERLLREAEARVERQGTNESRSAMRVLLRHKNSKVRIGAVDQLTKLLRAERAAAKTTDGPEDLSAFLHHVEEMSDEELEDILAEFTEHYRKTRGAEAGIGQDETEGSRVEGADGAR